MSFFKKFLGYVRADRDIVADRVMNCRDCEFITPKFRCTQCGCFMKVKTLIANAKCPIGKW